MPSPCCILRVDSATAGTGTDVVCVPPSPAMSNRTSQEPEAIIQRLPANEAGSAEERDIGSDVGGCFAASPVIGRGRDVDAADVRTTRSHFYGCDAGNDGRHADGDVELVGSGFDLLEDILAAYVSVRCLRNRRECRGAGRGAGEGARRQASPLHAPHPASEAQTDPGADRAVDGGAQQTEVEDRAVIWVEEAAQAIKAFRSRVVVEVDGAEEAILGCFGEQEVGEGPFDDYEHGDEEEAGDESNFPWFPCARSLPEKIERRVRERRLKLGIWRARSG